MSDSKITIELTVDQREALAQLFGEAFASKVRGIEVTKVDGDAKTVLLKN